MCICSSYNTVCWCTCTTDCLHHHRYDIWSIFARKKENSIAILVSKIVSNKSIIIIQLILFNSLPYDPLISPNYELTYLITIFSLVTANSHFGGTNTLYCVISFHVVGIIKDLRLTIKELDDPIE